MTAICRFTDWPEDLEHWRASKGYFVPLQGNHGDSLIELGAREVLRRLEIQLVDQPELSDVIVVNGGGGFAAGFYDHGYSIFSSLSRKYPNTPLVLLPSTLHFSSAVESFVAALSERTAPVWLYVRDQKSFDLLRTLSFNDLVSIRLDHDMAFYLKGSALLEQWQVGLGEATLLVVERLDLEQSTLGNPYLNWMTRHHTWFKRKWFRWANQRAVLGRLGKTQFLRASKRRFSDVTGRSSPKVVCEDISLASSFDFDHFVDAVRSASMVVSTRLHVAILAALLGKRVYLQATSGDYVKIQSVYEQSLRHFPGVDLLPPFPDEALQEARALVFARERKLLRRSAREVGPRCH